ncbi:hypothetical protein N474_09850 [Pseudoalteromonas luteoviolacea CPMOR-2]|nr:hypothetical protein N474_09850 [Pseudoalteromonas luteoviolacea CPMOR-2]
MMLLNPKSILSLLCCVALFGCSTAFKTLSMNPEPPQVSYEGRGKAAGPMLMGAMGPMGIAVGIAIDQGIGKDIETALMESLTENQFNLVEKVAVKYPAAKSFTINSLSFKAAPGDDDLAYVTTTITIYPSQNIVCFDSEPALLDALKSSAAGWGLIADSLSNEVECKA